MCAGREHQPPPSTLKNQRPATVLEKAGHNAQLDSRLRVCVCECGEERKRKGMKVDVTFFLFSSLSRLLFPLVFFVRFVLFGSGGFLFLLFELRARAPIFVIPVGGRGGYPAR